ncbi:MAG: crotonase/enoyl-CoA hydratase family protein [Betaproteobacteria bacterium]
MNDRVNIAIDEGVADVRLNRPDKLNALDAAMFDALIEAGESLRARRDLRAVVLSGNGRAFCAGLDMNRFEGMASGSDTPASLRLGPRSHGSCNVPQYAAMVWRDIPVPVIAAVQGAALGGGLQIALGADIRIAAPDARLALMEIRWGIVPDMGGTVILKELMPADRIRELAFTGRVVSGREACELGLVTRCSETPLEDALALARDIATRNPEAIRAVKSLIASSFVLDEPEQLLRESQAQIAVLGRPNQVEAVQAQLQKRAPSFAYPD